MMGNRPDVVDAVIEADRSRPGRGRRAVIDARGCTAVTDTSASDRTMHRRRREPRREAAGAIALGRSRLVLLVAGVVALGVLGSASAGSSSSSRWS